MKKVLLKTGDEQDFFRHGIEIARLADGASPLPAERILSFEDPMDLLKLLTGGRLDVLRSVRQSPGSITAIAQRLHRDRSAVKRDVDQLVDIGMVTVESKVLPGHGRMKEVRATASQFRLEATVM